MMLSMSLSAQRGERENRSKKGEKIEQQRVAYITTQLDLTVEEAQAFWPIYNYFQLQKRESGIEKREMKDIDQISDQEAEAMLSQAMEAKKRHSELEVNFMNRLKGVLSAKKRLKLLRLEREFKKSVLKRYQKRMKRSNKSKEKKEGKDNRDEKK